MFAHLLTKSITSLIFLSSRLPAIRGVFSNTRKRITWNTNIRKNVIQQHPSHFSGNRFYRLNGVGIYYWLHHVVTKWATRKAWTNSGNGAFPRKLTGSAMNPVISPRRTVTGFSLGGLLGFFWPKEEMTVEETAILSMKKAILAIQREQYDLAEKHLAQALSTCQVHNLEDGITQVLDMQANLALQRGELERAENLFKNVVQRLIGLGKFTVTDNPIVEISIKLSELYCQLGRFDEAITGLLYCINIQQHKILKDGVEDEDTLLLAAWALETLSNIYLTRVSTARGNSDDPNVKALTQEAKSLAERACTYATKAVGPHSMQAVSTRNNVALASAFLGDYETALSILRELEEITREHLEALYPDIVISIGDVYLLKSELESAVAVCDKGKSLASRFKDTAAFERAEQCILKCKQLQKDMRDAQEQKA